MIYLYRCCVGWSRDCWKVYLFLLYERFYIKTVNFSGTILYNSKIGDVGTDIAYIKVTDAFKYMRLSNGTSILKSVKMYPISNEDFNKHLIFNVGK